MNIRPIGGRVLVRPLPDEAVTDSGLILLDGISAYSRGGSTAAEYLPMGKGGSQPRLPWATGEVVSVSEQGKRSKDATGRDPIFVKPGDKVLYDERGAYPTELGGEALLIVNPQGLKAVLG